MLPHILLLCGNFLFLVPCDKLTYKYTIRNLCFFCQGRVVLSESDGWHELWSGATHRNWVSFEMCLLPFSCPEQSEATALCLWAYLTRNLEQSCKPQICEKESNQEKKRGLCIWRLVRKNQFAWKWRCHFPQGWFVLLKLLTRSCRNVPWNRGFSQVEGEKTLTLGWAQVAGERLPLNTNSPRVEGRPLWTVCHCSSS